MSLLEAPPSRKNVGAMFDRIAGRYDLLNRLLSGRRDVAWRKKVAKKISKDKEIVLLDLATGTGDLLFSIMNSHPNILKGIGIDISQGMLDKGIEKISNILIVNQTDLTCYTHKKSKFLCLVNYKEKKLPRCCCLIGLQHLIHYMY